MRFIQKAGDTAAASAARRDDLSADFDRLDNFLAELGPTSAQLGGHGEAVDAAAGRPERRGARS